VRPTVVRNAGPVARQLDGAGSLLTTGAALPVRADAQAGRAGSHGASAWLAVFGERRPGSSNPLSRDGGWPTAAETPGARERRLHLLDASGDRSPALAQSESCRVIFDGTLYNRDDLVARFADRPPPDPSDADLVGHAYRSGGEDAIRQLRGVFALVIEDSARDLVVCARDPLGMHPLFYAEVGGALLLSPAVETLLGHPGVSADVNRALLVDYLTRRWPVNDETYFTHIRRVPPGHIMRIGRDVRQLYRYWNPLPAGRSFEWGPDGEVQERFDVLLERAVARCLAVGPAGIYLSGGLDSSAVAMVATDLSRRQGRPVPTGLSLSFPNLACDDTERQRRVATELGLSHVGLPYDQAAGPEGTLAATLAMTRDLPAPLSLIWRPALTRLALEGRQRGCRVVLTGDGADDWLLENAFLAVDFLRSLNLVGLYRLCQIYCRSFHFTPRQALRMLLWRYAGRSLLRDTWRRAADRMGAPGMVPRQWRFPVLMRLDPPAWIAPDSTLRARVAERIEERFASGVVTSRIDSYYLRDMRSWLDTPEKWFLHEEAFLLGQRSGIPIRQPFWDPDLIEFLAKVRPLGKSERGLSKALVRKPVVRRFPHLGFEGQRKSWLGEAVGAVLSTQLGPQRQAIGAIRALSELGVVDAEQGHALLDDAVAGKGSPSGPWYAWHILNLETWVRAHR
jgi:asparagine synthetase B (glutamine-hydrolysing)